MNVYACGISVTLCDEKNLWCMAVISVHTDTLELFENFKRCFVKKKIENAHFKY